MTREDAERQARDAGHPLGEWQRSRDLPHLMYAYSQAERPVGGSVAVGVDNEITGVVSLMMNGAWQ